MADVMWNPFFADYIEKKREWRRLKLKVHNARVQLRNMRSSRIMDHPILYTDVQRLSVLERFFESAKNNPILARPDAQARLLKLVADWRESDLVEYDVLTLRAQMPLAEVQGKISALRRQRRDFDEIRQAQQNGQPSANPLFTPSFINRAADVRQTEIDRLSGFDLVKAQHVYDLQMDTLRALRDHIRHNTGNLVYAFPDYPLLMEATYEQTG